jgi:hypothetical protein
VIVNINTKDISIQAGPLSYDTIVRAVGGNPEHIYTVVYKYKQEALISGRMGIVDFRGTITPGKSIVLEPEMSSIFITAMITGNA